VFFVFEGIDGCGKSTQVQACSERLGTESIEHVTCRDPGSTRLGDRIRGLLLNHDDVPIGAVSEMLLFMVARAQLISEVICPAIKQGQVVLCDRFLLSTIAYQGFGHQQPLDRIHQVGQIATGGLKPDATFVFDIPLEVSRQRVGNVRDRLESRKAPYFERVRQGFLKEAEHDDTIHVLDGAETPASIHDQVMQIVLEILEVRP